jgi:hypothetical protein
LQSSFELTHCKYVGQATKLSGPTTSRHVILIGDKIWSNSRCKTWQPRIRVAICHSQRPRTPEPLCHFPDVSQSRLVCHIGTVPFPRFDSFRFALIVQISFRDLILIVVLGVPIRPKMSKCYQFGVTQAVAFGIPPNHLKKRNSLMSSLRSGPEKGLVSLFYVRLLLCRYSQRVQHRIRVHRL